MCPAVHANTNNLNSTAALSDGRLRHDNMTLTFDPLTPKPNQFIFVQDAPMTTVWLKSINTVDTGDIAELYDLGCTDRGQQNITVQYKLHLL